MSVTVIYEFLAARSRASELLELLRQVRDFGRTVEHCESFDIYQADTDPHRLVMIETWASADAHQEHFEKNVQATGVLDQAIALMAKQPETSGAYFARR
jgi:quinol monooxygenase YgiN